VIQNAGNTRIVNAVGLNLLGTESFVGGKLAVPYVALSPPPPLQQFQADYVGTSIIVSFYSFLVWLVFIGLPTLAKKTTFGRRIIASLIRLVRLLLAKKSSGRALLQHVRGRTWGRSMFALEMRELGHTETAVTVRKQLEDHTESGEELYLQGMETQSLEGDGNEQQGSTYSSDEELLPSRCATLHIDLPGHKGSETIDLYALKSLGGLQEFIGCICEERGVNPTQAMQVRYIAKDGSPQLISKHTTFKAVQNSLELFLEPKVKKSSQHRL